MSQNAVRSACSSALAPGWWYAECCIHGLTQIQDADELSSLQILLTEDWYATLFQGAWPTQEDAMQALAGDCAGGEE